MPYMEPGAYLKVVENGAGGAGITPALTPLIMGSGATILERTEVLTRGTGNSDSLPVAAKSIKLIGYTADKADFAVTTDYTFTAETTDITWAVNGKKPAAGEKYTVVFTYKVGAEQYNPRLIYSLDDIKKYYGTDTMTEEGGAVNPIAVGLKLALEMGAIPVYALQVAPNGTSGDVTSIEYQSALDTHAKFIEGIWRIVPMDLADEINAVIDGHIRAMSTYEERMERCTVYGKAHADFTTFDELLTSIGGYAQSKKNRRVIVPYPDQATKILDDGNYHTLGAPFIAAAYAGLEAALPVQQSKTRARIGAFNELKGFKMTRAQKNALAEKGVMVLEQPFGPGTDAIIRHQLTTDMTTIQTKESSILAVEDYASKYLRDVVEQYIGKYNITPDTITKVTGSLNAAIAQLIADGVIVSGGILNMAQDVNNPDTLLIEMQILPPYPCNYIKITLYVD